MSARKIPSRVVSVLSSADVSILVDRNERKALLAAINCKLSHYERMWEAISNGDRELMAEGRNDYEIVWGVLDALDWWTVEQFASEFCVTAPREWLLTLIEWWLPQIQGCIVDNTEQLQEAVKEGEAAFKPGGSGYDNTPASEAHWRYNRHVQEFRDLIDHDGDEMAGMLSIRAKVIAASPDNG